MFYRQNTWCWGPFNEHASLKYRADSTNKGGSVFAGAKRYLKQYWSFQNLLLSFKFARKFCFEEILKGEFCQKF